MSGPALLDIAARILLHRGMGAGPNLTDKKQAEHAAREARLATALRDNLRRRKEQERARATPADAGPGDLSGAPLSSTSKRHGGKD